MGKSSSSLKKKKRSKIYSQARIKRRSKSRTRRSYKLKKLRDGSVSYSSDDNDSRSLVSISSSSPEDDNRSKRSRSRTRKDVKGSKKRTRRRSSSHESIEDSPRVKKRKASKKNDDFRVKKKRSEKKKKKKKKMKKSVRDVSVSSTSSMSWSCSTCHGRSDESEIEKKRGRSERKGKDIRRRGEKVKNKSKMRRSRSSSRSSLFSQFSEYSDHKIDDTIVRETNSRRLRSVITVVREGEDMTGMFIDEHKEEMVYDHDDYPSSRSNDSNDGGSRRELVHNSHVASEGKKHPDGKGEALSNIRTFKVSESDGDIEGHDGSNPRCDGFDMNGNEKEKKNQDSGGIDSQSGHDLELILRQKALENLRIRRGHQADAKVSINEKDAISCEINTSTTNFGSSQNKFSEGGGASDVAKWSSISTDLPQNDDKISKGNGNGKGSGSAKHDVQHPPRQLALASNPKERISVPVSSETNNPGSVVLASNPELSSASTIKKQLRTLHEPPQTMSITRDSVGKSMIETMPTVNSLSGNNNGEETNNVSVSGDPSCIKSPCGGTSSNKPQDETSEGSQYQQKTMTVMRGGEMVEVSYKVYIPKKAPALARRQLKR